MTAPREIRLDLDEISLAALVWGDGDGPLAVLLHGGRFSAGPRRSGGHTVRATLAVDGRAVSPREEAGPDVTVVAATSFGKPAAIAAISYSTRRVSTDTAPFSPTVRSTHAARGSPSLGLRF